MKIRYVKEITVLLRKRFSKFLTLKLISFFLVPVALHLANGWYSINIIESFIYFKNVTKISIL